MPYLDFQSLGGTKVGLFWVIENTVVAVGLPIGRADAYGDCLTYDGGHSDHWDAWNDAGPTWLKEHQLPATICATEYDQHPRGRAIFDKTLNAFVIYADRRLHSASTIRRIVEEFGLQEEMVQVKSDLHYR